MIGLILKPFSYEKGFRCAIKPFAKDLKTGDAEEKSESDMLAKKLVPSVDVLKVGHHGAKTSTSSAFINKAKPKYAGISVGKNGYGHPTSTVVKR
ncbi:hypothetical protein IOC57_16455 [Bacillus sp. SD075]|uniref:ComEC/Rec2 family competence protein n=1 Tax=Bacillus sp. SD075 TaxID=2781732 RepID=UPI001A9586EE|nr:hypothetical protein [Bacillus sp. SD075]MBO0999324.1 hypothetical protein [Bacillus sp. SD075]